MNTDANSSCEWSECISGTALFRVPGRVTKITEDDRSATHLFRAACVSIIE